MSRHSRRQFLRGSLALAGLGLLSGCGLLPPQRQQPASIPRIGWLSAGVPANPSRLIAFQQGLDELGYVEGQNIAIEERWAEGNVERLPELAAELVRVRVAVVVAGGNAPIRAARDGSRTGCLRSPSGR